MKTQIFTTLILLVTVLMSSCAAAPATTYTKADNGSTITVNAGDTFSIKLEGNPTTGYAWEMLPDPAGLISLVGEPDYDSSSDMIGAGGVYTFTFKAAAAGQTTLELIYHKSFEPGVDPLETFKVTVEIK